MIIARNFLNSSIVESATTSRPYLVHSHSLAVQLLSALNLYYTPFLILFGCFGNFLSLYIFFKTLVRLQSTSVYLSALAVSDTLFLLQLVIPWLDGVQFSMHFCIPAVCYTITYISYVTSSLSTWIVVAFTVERYVAVLHPLQRSLICTVRRAKSLIAFLATTIVLLNLPVFKFLSPPDNCSIDSSYLDYASRFNTIDTAISFTVPMGAIIVLNVRIMFAVWKLDRARDLLLRVDQQPRPSRMRHMRPLARPQHRVTKMLLIVSSVFVVLNVPAYTMRMMAYTKTNQPQGGVWGVFQQLASIFFDTNFGVNFLLYCLSGRNFRLALCKEFPFLRRYLRHNYVMTVPCPQIRSISTSYTGADPDVVRIVDLPAGPSEGQAQVRRHLSEPVIRRWTFDNSRQRLQNEEIELSTFENRRQRVRNEALEMPNFDNRRQQLRNVALEMPNFNNRRQRLRNEALEVPNFDNRCQRLRNEALEMPNFDNRRQRPRNEALGMPNFDNRRQRLRNEALEMANFDNRRQRLRNEALEMPNFDNRRQRPRNEALEMPNFDNRRQIIPHEEFEMRNYNNIHVRAQHEEGEMAIMNGDRNVTPDLIRDTRGHPPPGQIRNIALLLFPNRHLGGGGQAEGSMVSYN